VENRRVPENKGKKGDVTPFDYSAMIVEGFFHRFKETCGPEVAASLVGAAVEIFNSTNEKLSRGYSARVSGTGSYEEAHKEIERT